MRVLCGDPERTGARRLAGTASSGSQAHSGPAIGVVTPFPTGEQYRLTHGTHHAVIVERGAGLREYGSDRGPFVDGYAEDQMADGSRGQLLLPWPNRIANAAYRFDGHEFRLPVTEPRTGSAIHGLTHNLLWQRVDMSASTVTLALDLQPMDGYPFHLALRATYSLDDDGLTVTVSATNQGEAACPYGAGAHPYVRIASGGTIDAALLRIPASTMLDADGRGIPTGAEEAVAGTPLDFRSQRPIGTQTLDTAFTGLAPGADNTTRISLAEPDGEHGLVVWMDASHRYAMIYSGDTLGDVARRRHGLAIEPMTCAPDAFNSGAGLVILQPAEGCTSTWGIAPF
jgi:galactose mutarotase-like enzyme